MLQELAADRAAQRGVWWVHVARDREPSTPSPRRPTTARSRCRTPRSTSFTPQPDAPPSDERRSSAGVGRPSMRLRALGFPVDAAAYICGPIGVHAADCKTLCQQLGLAADHVHTEVFGAVVSHQPRASSAPSIRRRTHPPASVGTGPSISFVRSDLTVPWSDRYRSILELAEACDVPTRWSCRTGRLPHLRHAVVVGPDRVRRAAVGNACGAGHPGLLQSPRQRHRPRPLTPTTWVWSGYASPSVLHQRHLGRVLRRSGDGRRRGHASSCGREPRAGRRPPLRPGDLRNDGGRVATIGGVREPAWTGWNRLPGRSIRTGTPSSSAGPEDRRCSPACPSGSTCSS